MNDHLSLHQLELFCAVVDHGSYVATAKQLMVTQPAVSLQVKALQTTLGTQFFERKNNRMNLTQTGRITYEFAQNLLALEQQLKKTVEGVMKSEQGEISIGSARPFGKYFIPLIVSEFLQEHERMDVSVVFNDTETIYNQVLNRILDVGVVTSDEALPLPPGLHATELRHDYWCLVSAVDRPWSDVSRISKQLFARAPFITAVSHSPHWKLIHNILTSIELEPTDYQIRLRMEDLEAIKVVVQHGLGIAFLPYSSVKNELTSGQLMEFAFPDEHPSLNCVIVTMDHMKNRPAVQRFTSFLSERFPLNSDFHIGQSLL